MSGFFFLVELVMFELFVLGEDWFFKKVIGQVGDDYWCQVYYENECQIVQWVIYDYM